MNEIAIKVKMLGGFSLYYNDKSFSIERNSSTKVNQLLQLLLYNPDGIERTQLIENLFDGEVVTNPSNSLRALVFRLRKVLPEHGLPADDYINISRGIYSWTESIPVECDAHIFENKAYEAQVEMEPEKRAKLLKEACDIYEGDFLPMLTGVNWAVAVEVRLKKLFNECCGELCSYYAKNRMFDELLVLSQKAAKLYPYNEWQCYEMQALLELKREKEAIKLYEDTETLMFEELGVSVSSEMTAMLDKLGAQVKNRTDLISTVKNNLDTTKKDEDGAFYCTYPVFLESYRYIKRVINRSGQSAWLMLCTITDGKGYALEGSDRLEGLMQELAESITCSVRGGDMFTRYSDNQYIILLLGIVKEDCILVQRRINGNMEKESRKRYIQYNLAPVNQNKNSDSDEIDDLLRGLE